MSDTGPIEGEDGLIRLQKLLAQSGVASRRRLRASRRLGVGRPLPTGASSVTAASIRTGQQNSAILQTET